MTYKVMWLLMVLATKSLDLMVIGALGVDDEPSYRYINVDRPFIFVIDDSQPGVTLFMGEYRGDEKAKKLH